ncbi:MAG: GH3 auxin-responsive promoter family protein [Saprospiraceae bacterium]
MSIVGQLLHTGIKYAPKKSLIKQNPKQKQINVLHQLLKYAQHTAFGKRYDFKDLIRLKDPRSEFKKWIPVYHYEEMYIEWWQRSRQDEPDLAWPGITPYYGISSGSTQSSSKYIPVTQESLNGWSKTAQKLFTSLAAYPEITAALLSKQSLMVGGSSHLIREGLHFYSDNSGIIAICQ